jgi:hypothetical protein
MGYDQSLRALQNGSSVRLRKHTLVSPVEDGFGVRGGYD